MRRKLTILLVDPDELELKRLKQITSQSGFEVVVANSGEAGLEEAFDSRPHIVLVADKLGDMNAAEFIEAGVASTTYRTRYIVMTEDVEQLSPALLRQADEVLRRPIIAQEMVLRLSNMGRFMMRKNRLQLALKQARRQKDRVSRYVSVDLMERILNEETDQSDHSYENASILFFDIRDSTSIAEQIGPQAFSQFLGELIFDIMDLVYGNYGSVNKVLGDGLMATFGCPNPSGQEALNAIKCALQIKKHMQVYNSLRSRTTQGKIGFGIGIATGPVFSGTIGSVHRMEYAVLGDPVNIAARLEALTRPAEVDILMDDRTHEEAGVPLNTEKIRHTRLRGRTGELEIYHLKDLAGRQAMNLA